MEENWFEILEISHKEEKFLEYLKKEFDKNKIKYKIDLKEEWEGPIRTPKYTGKFRLSIQEEEKSKAEEIINQYCENNMRIEEEQEVQENKEDIETESKKIDQKQRIMKRILAIIILGMIASMIIAGIINS